ncbi:hypothetical protein BN14_11443 [Rhizoctonia solani AG-1 IB]|uniref:Uncharacterized protein n=1 Tax=Thanatephorus cucumeris (strain AG1-IB / isolate 7/3/14) TaxID=1108050 RepID=M5CBB1_THACB|nr:hypothetical protein BN14_11443 [Rhizoctonia solani AG-1 IB]
MRARKFPKKNCSTHQSNKTSTKTAVAREHLVSEEFEAEVKKALEKDKYTVREWFEMILQGKEGTVIQEAISGLYLIATGIASISSSDLTQSLGNVFSDLQRDIMKAVDQTPINELVPEDLYRRYKSTKNTSNPLNKQLENVLLQHRVLCVQAFWVYYIAMSAATHSASVAQRGRNPRKCPPASVVGVLEVLIEDEDDRANVHLNLADIDQMIEEDEDEPTKQECA